MKILLLTVLALIAFAGNSILNRLALAGDEIDPYSFAAVRLFSGALMLALVMFLTMRAKSKGSEPKLDSASGSWKGGIALFVYAIAFSIAYVTLETGIGALILFGTVQLTMILSGLVSGQGLKPYEWLGVFIACVGFVYLVAPTLYLPSFMGFILMALAGMTWGVYSIVGKQSKAPLFDTAYNFIRTLPFVIVLVALTFPMIDLSLYGIWLACLSGIVTSALGYTIWYMALTGLSTVQAAMVQLLVPVVAALGGVWLMDEQLTARTLISGLVILGAILLVILGNFYSSKAKVVAQSSD